MRTGAHLPEEIFVIFVDGLLFNALFSLYIHVYFLSVVNIDSSDTHATHRGLVFIVITYIQTICILM